MPSSPQCVSKLWAGSQPRHVERVSLVSCLSANSCEHPARRPQVGVFNEAALQRFDLVLSEAAKNGIKVIFPLVDGDDFLGGPQWYYDQARTACSQAGRLAAAVDVHACLKQTWRKTTAMHP